MTIGGGIPYLGDIKDGGTGLFNQAQDNLHVIRNSILPDGDVIAFQWTQALAVVPNFNINDIQVILRLWVG